MIVLPAVDLQGGRQVGLVEGSLAHARVYGDPVVFAVARAADGYEGLHVVDLDGAAEGRPIHLETVRRLRAAAPALRLEVGGGVRTLEDALAVRAAGADTVIVGTAAVAPLLAEGDAGGGDLLRSLLDRLGPEAVAVAVDVRGRRQGEVALAAWRSSVPADLARLAERLAALGVRRTVCTDAGRDGSLRGVRTAAVRALAAAGLEVAAGGGVAGERDLAALARAGAWAAIVGRAFHAGGWRPPPRTPAGARGEVGA